MDGARIGQDRTAAIGVAARNGAAWALLVPGDGGWAVREVGRGVTIGSDGTVGVEGTAGRHARFTPGADGNLRVRDLGAPDGTWLRGVRLGVREDVLLAGDTVRLGRLPVVVARCERVAGRRWLEIGGLQTGAPAMIGALADLALAAASEVPVLIRGESGTGKEAAARLVHDRSLRARGPFVALNCGALHGDTVLAELMGAQRGAYTGAVEARKGAFERAHGGTLFLDELGELPPAAQAMLLRVLETGEVQVLGGAARQVDVRVVCATHRDLARDVEAGRFRLDLLYRLAVAEVVLPPLRERNGDAAALLERWLDAPLAADARAVLADHVFPGNVRELRNLLRRLEFRAPAIVPSAADLARELRGPGKAAATLARSRRHTRHPPEARAQSLELATTAATTRSAWRLSGLPRSTFYRYLRAARSERSAP